MRQEEHNIRLVRLLWLLRLVRLLWLLRLVWCDRDPMRQWPDPCGHDHMITGSHENVTR
jgi:hypothetical protein